jgi:hypothetical protein
LHPKESSSGGQKQESERIYGGPDRCTEYMKILNGFNVYHRAAIFVEKKKVSVIDFARVVVEAHRIELEKTIDKVTKDLSIKMVIYIKEKIAFKEEVICAKGSKLVIGKIKVENEMFKT